MEGRADPPHREPPPLRVQDPSPLRHGAAVVLEAERPRLAGRLRKRPLVDEDAYRPAPDRNPLVFGPAPEVRLGRGHEGRVRDDVRRPLVGDGTPRQRREVLGRVLLHAAHLAGHVSSRAWNPR